MWAHPVWLLAIVTLVLVGAVAVWSLASVKRQQKHGPNVSGIGGPNDPMA